MNEPSTPQSETERSIPLSDRVASGNIRRIKELVPELKVIYTDIDGTLVGPGGCFFKTGGGELSLIPALALLQALSAGIEVVLVSGRNRRQLLEDARLLGLRDYIAEMGGLVVLDLDREAHPAPHLAAGDRTPFEAMLAEGVLDALLGEFPALHEYLPWSREREFTALFRGHVEVGQVNQYLEGRGWGHLHLVDNGRVGIYLDSSHDRPHAYHLVPKGVAKETGVAHHRRLRGVAVSSCIAVGDAVADVAFAEEVGASFILGNGLARSPELEVAVAEKSNVFVTQNEMGLGWAEVIELFLGPLEPAKRGLFSEPGTLASEPGQPFLTEG